MTTDAQLFEELRPNLSCKICRDFFVDAVTLTECRHSFCRHCLLISLQKSNKCPKCSKSIGTDLNKAFTFDEDLQNIVYKTNPNFWLLQRIKRVNPSSSELKLIRRNNLLALASWYCDEKETISFVVEYVPAYRVLQSLDLPTTELPSTSSDEENTFKRYFRCPASVKLEHIKKILELKLAASDMFLVYLVDNKLLYVLEDEIRLQDVVYLYRWNRTEPLQLLFTLVRQPMDDEEPPPVLDAEEMPSIESQRSKADEKSAEIMEDAAKLLTTPKIPKLSIQLPPSSFENGIAPHPIIQTEQPKSKSDKPKRTRKKKETSPKVSSSPALVPDSTVKAAASTNPPPPLAVNAKEPGKRKDKKELKKKENVLNQASSNDFGGNIDERTVEKEKEAKNAQPNLMNVEGYPSVSAPHQTFQQINNNRTNVSKAAKEKSSTTSNANKNAKMTNGAVPVKQNTPASKVSLSPAVVKQSPPVTFTKTSPPNQIPPMISNFIGHQQNQHFPIPPQIFPKNQAVPGMAGPPPMASLNMFNGMFQNMAAASANMAAAGTPYFPALMNMGAAMNGHMPDWGTVMAAAMMNMNPQFCAGNFSLPNFASQHAHGSTTTASSSTNTSPEEKKPNVSKRKPRARDPNEPPRKRNSKQLPTMVTTQPPMILPKQQHQSTNKNVLVKGSSPMKVPNFQQSPQNSTFSFSSSASMHNKHASTNSSFQSQIADDSCQQKHLSPSNFSTKEAASALQMLAQPTVATN